MILKRCFWMLLLLVALAGNIYAYTGNANEIVLTVGSKEAQVFKRTVVNDVSPIIASDRTMLPARFVAESLGADVLWNDSEKKVTISKSDVEIILFSGSETAYVNGSEVRLDSPTFILNDRIYTPVRFVAENLGAKVRWIGESYKVVIDKNPWVNDGISYSKQVFNYNAGVAYDNGKWYHTVNLPQIDADTDGAISINNKIMSNYSDVIETLNGNSEGTDIYEISYNYTIYNGYIGIFISAAKGWQYGEYVYSYDVYYYNTSTGQELTFTEYLSGLNIDFELFSQKINSINTSPLPYDIEPAVLGTSLEDSNRITDAVLGADKTVLCFKYDIKTYYFSCEGIMPSIVSAQNASGVENALYQYYLDNKDSLTNKAPAQYLNTFIADLDNDGIPELCNYYRFNADIIDIYKYDDGEVYKTKTNISAGYGYAYLQTVSLVLLPNGRIKITEMTESENTGELREYYWYEAGAVNISKLSQNQNTGIYTYSENNTDELLISAEQFHELYTRKMDEYNASSIVDVKNCSFYEIWQEQQDLLVV